MRPASIEDVRIEAGRRFFQWIDEHIEEKRNLVVESTLSGLTFRNVVKRARQGGFKITIIFVFLGSESACIARIRERVRKSGHAVSEKDIRRRFSRSNKNFWIQYRALADRWHLSYNGGAQFHEVALGEGTGVEVRDEILFGLFLRLAGEKI